MTSPAATPSDKPPADIARLYALRQEWLERAERDLKAAQFVAEAPNFPEPGALVKRLQAILDAASDADCLGEEDRTRLADRSRAIARTAYLRFFEHVVGLAYTGRVSHEDLQFSALQFRHSQSPFGPLLRKDSSVHA